MSLNIRIAYVTPSTWSYT